MRLLLGALAAATLVHGTLASSARGSRAARVRFWRAYCRTARPTPGTRALARWVLRKAERLRSHGLKGPRAD